MYPVNFTEKMSVNLTHAHTVCTRPSLSQREGPGDEATLPHGSLPACTVVHSCEVSGEDKSDTERQGKNHVVTAKT